MSEEYCDALTIDVFPAWSISSLLVFLGRQKAVISETNGHFSIHVWRCQFLGTCMHVFWCPHSVPVKSYYLLSISAPCQTTINFCFNLVTNKRKNNITGWGRTTQPVLKCDQAGGRGKGTSLQLPSHGPKTCVKVKCKCQRKTEGSPETGTASPSEVVLAPVLTALRAAPSGISANLV